MAGANNIAVNFAVQKIGLPAPGVPAVRVLFVALGLVVLGSDLVQLLGLTQARVGAAGQALREWRWRQRQRALRDAGHPTEPTADLVRRQQELDRLHERLSGSRRVFVSGMPGVGKTQLAATYVAERSSEYDGGVYWLRGDKQATLTSVVFAPHERASLERMQMRMATVAALAREEAALMDRASAGDVHVYFTLLEYLEDQGPFEEIWARLDALERLVAWLDDEPAGLRVV